MLAAVFVVGSSLLAREVRVERPARKGTARKRGPAPGRSESSGATSAEAARILPSEQTSVMSPNATTHRGP